MVLHLIRDDASAQRMLQWRNAPRRPGEHLLMTRTDQQQIRQDRNAERLLDALLLRRDLVLSQPKVCLELPIDVLDVIVTTHKTIALVFPRPTVCLYVTSLVASRYGYNDGKNGPTRCAVIGAARGDR